MTESNLPTATDVGSRLTPEQRAKMQAFAKQQAAQQEQTTESGSEAVRPDAGTTNKGTDVKWEEYDIPYALRHFYPQATYRDTPEGPKWVVMTDLFQSVTKDFGSHGKQTKKGETLNLGEYLSEMLNNGDGWRAISILPTSGGQAGVLLQRQVPYILPDPVLLKTDTEVEPPKDPELERANDAALLFMQNEGLSAQLEEEARQQQERSEPVLVKQALELNPTTAPPRAEEGHSPKDARTAVDFALGGADFGDQEVIDRIVAKMAENAEGSNKVWREGEEA
jgi:hypothetical protein